MIARNGNLSLVNWMEYRVTCIYPSVTLFRNGYSHYPIFKFEICRPQMPLHVRTCVRMDVRDTWRHIGAIENCDRAGATFSRPRDRSVKIKVPLVRTCELVE